VAAQNNLLFYLGLLETTVERCLQAIGAVLITDSGRFEVMAKRRHVLERFLTVDPRNLGRVSFQPVEHHT
jgi:hypothetical protein